MNGMAFANVPRLIAVGLKNNICVDKNFAIQNQNSFRRRISRNCALAGVARKEISCKANWPCVESATERFLLLFNRTATECCILDFEVIIDAPDYAFVSDANYRNIEVINILYQQSIEFLPVLVYAKFPNLKFYQVMETPIQKISKENFKKMFKLWFLLLQSNQIEVIKKNTFEDLISLKYLTIGIYDCFSLILLMLTCYF